MANINHKFRRIMAVGCTHGDLADLRIQNEVLAFRKEFRPEIRIELGDLIDTAAFRSGARGTPDEAKKIEPDEFAAGSWLTRFEPTVVLWGNHDWRLQKMMQSQNAILSYAAGMLWNSLQETTRKLKAKTYPYDIAKGWCEIGGTWYTHGYFFNESAVRDHAEYIGGPVVMAHLHRALEERGRTRSNSKSFCVGMLGDPSKFEYARFRRATSRWSHGCVWGEVSDKQSHLWLSSCNPGDSLHFPSF